METLVNTSLENDVVLCHSLTFGVLLFVKDSVCIILFLKKIELNPIISCILAILHVAFFRGIVHNYFDMVSCRLIPMESS